MAYYLREVIVFFFFVFCMWMCGRCHFILLISGLMSQCVLYRTVLMMMIVKTCVCVYVGVLLCEVCVCVCVGIHADVCLRAPRMEFTSDHRSRACDLNKGYFRVFICSVTHLLFTLKMNMRVN